MGKNTVHVEAGLVVYKDGFHLSAAVNFDWRKKQEKIRAADRSIWWPMFSLVPRRERCQYGYSVFVLRDTYSGRHAPVSPKLLSHDEQIMAWMPLFEWRTKWCRPGCGGVKVSEPILERIKGATESNRLLQRKADCRLTGEESVEEESHGRR